MAKKKKKQKYYAVRVGRVPGIYRSWAECKEQVDYFRNAEFKSFTTKEQADEFMQTGLISNNNTQKRRNTKNVAHKEAQNVKSARSTNKSSFCSVVCDNYVFERTNNHISPTNGVNIDIEYED